MVERSETSSGEKSEGAGGGRRFAVMLNDNAKRVTPKIREGLAELVSPEDLFFSTSMEEAEEITELLVRRRYPVVFTGGGDGTVVDFMDRITRVSEAMPDYPTPSIGILRLGTGNALAEMVSSGSYDSDLKAYVRNGFRDQLRLALIEAEGRRFPFAGLGFDAEILNDYSTVKDRYAGTPVVGNLMKNVGGYFAAVFMKTIPRTLGRTIRRKHPHVRVINLGDRANRLATGGSVRRVHGPGDVLYDGPFGIAMLGTAPFYGFGLKVLPYAGLTPSFMHLRVGMVPVGSALWNLRKLWVGEWDHEAIQDYYVQHVRLEFDTEVPFQIGGDGVGWRDHVEFKLSDASVQLVRFI